MNNPPSRRIGSSTIGHFCGGEMNGAPAEVRVFDAFS
jgi:hypothetical protein